MANAITTDEDEYNTHDDDVDDAQSIMEVICPDTESVDQDFVEREIEASVSLASLLVDITMRSDPDYPLDTDCWYV